MLTDVFLITCVVQGGKADEIFGFFNQAADIKRPQGGIMYMYPVHRATEYHLPEVPEEH